MRLLRRLLAPVLALVAPAFAAAQVVRGTVVDAAGAPVPGVIVALLDSGGGVAARALTNDRGEYRVGASRPGAYRLRTLRIGYHPVVSASLALAAGEERTERLTVSSLAFTLSTVQVRDRGSCRLDADSAAATFAVWEQVRGALTATQLTASARAIQATTVSFDRVLDRDFRRVREQSASVATGWVAQPWHTAPPDSLRRVGYVVAEPDGMTAYYGPGLDVLASDGFIADHCFRLTEARDTSLVGVAFEPTRDRRAIPDIAGTIWVDRRTSELRRLEFRYANVDASQGEHAGGDMSFVRLPTGAWAITSWSIRMPALAAFVLPNGTRQARVAEIHVTGGELALAMRGGDTLYARPPLVLAGTVRDSLTDAPIAGARLSLVGTPLHAVADALGRFALRDVLPGTYSLEVRTPSLDTLGVAHQQTIAFADASTPLRVRVPAGAQIAGALCPGRLLGADAGGILVGAVYARGDSTPRANVLVTAEWMEYVAGAGRGDVDHVSRRADARTDASGMFRLCGVPRTRPLRVQAVADSVGSASLEHRLDGAQLARLTLTLDPARAATATFVGTVYTDSTRRPIAGAEVVLPELSLTTTTDERGAFRLLDVPVGEQHVVVRRIGYGPLDTRVPFAANRVVERTIYLSAVHVVDSVLVVDTRPSLTGFDERRKIGLGVFLDSATLRKNDFHHFADALQLIPGIQTVGPPECGNHACGFRRSRKVAIATRIRGACAMEVYLNGALVFRGHPLRVSDADWEPSFDLGDIAMSELESVEIYRGASELPAQFSGTGAACGVLVLWTRR